MFIHLSLIWSIPDALLSGQEKEIRGHIFWSPLNNKKSLKKHKKTIDRRKVSALALLRKLS
jgi:hypothetical protein